MEKVIVVDNPATKRFVTILNGEAKSLLDKAGNELNPTGIIKDEDDREYVYSLASLDHVLGILTSFFEEVSNKKENKTWLAYQLDFEKCRALPSEIAFYLRGYIKVLSEDRTVYDDLDVEGLQTVLYLWSVDMSSRDLVGNLTTFLWNCEVAWLKKFKGVTDKQIASKKMESVIEECVLRKLSSLKDAMFVSRSVVEGIFNSAWLGYEVLNDRLYCNGEQVL